MSTVEIVAILTLALLASSWALAQDARTNLAPNPSFEDGDEFGPAEWETRPAPGSTSRFEWVEGVAHSGERSIFIESDAEYQVADRWRAGFDRTIGLKPGTEATMSAWVKTEAAEGFAQVQVYVMGPAPPGESGPAILAQPVGGRVTGTTDWTEVSLTFTVPEGPSYVMPYVGIRGAGRAWFDDVRLEGVPAPPLPPGSTYEPHHFEELVNFERAERGGRSVLQVPTGSGEVRGVASVPFYDPSARWDVTLTYFDEPDGASTFRLLINDEEVGRVVADGVQGETDAAQEVREHTFEGLDIEHLSKITVVGESDGQEYARLVNLQFRPVGEFQGEPVPEDQLQSPNNLRVYQSPYEREQAGRGLARQVGRWESEDFMAVQREMEALETSEEVRAWQERVRASLPEIFGRWTGESGSPLNPQTVGRIELDYCTIEKVIIESEPGLYVPLHVYVPKGKPLPAPGICITIGHAGPGKQYHLYHEFGLGLAEKGYVAVALDPLGQGERTYWHEPPEELGARGGPVGQHHYELRRGFLVGRSLSGLRTRDTVRVVDYMLTRDEIIDPERIGVGGNSGGGQMALLTAACHPAVKVCCAAHPGGSCENTYYRGKRDQDRMVMSLIPPRALIWIVGEDSGEEHHLIRESWLEPLYEIFGAADAQKFEWVAGVHNLEQPKREAAYEWLNHWFGIDAGRAEGSIEHLDEEELWCTETGLVETSIGGVMPWDLDTRLMREMAPERPAPLADVDAAARFISERRAAVLQKVGLGLDDERRAPRIREAGGFDHPDLSVRKVAITTEPRLEAPALIIEPKSGASGPTVIHSSGAGKPRRFDGGALPWRLALAGRRVVSVDVRGKGELDIEGGEVSRVVEYDRIQWQRDGYAISYAGAGRTMMGARALDLIRVMDALDFEAGETGSYELVGEGIGGAWALIAALADERVTGVTTVGTLGSWQRLMESKWNALREYFWVPRALDTFDLSDLPALTRGASVAVVNPVDEMLHPLSAEDAVEDFAWARAWSGDRLRVECSRAPEDLTSIIRQPGGILR